MLLAVGAALFLGTGAALLAYRRNGVFPGQATDDADRPTRDVSVRLAVIKVLLGLLLAVVGAVNLQVWTWL